MILPNPCRGVTVLSQNFADGSTTVGKNTGIPFVPRGSLRDDSGRRRVVIASGDQRGTGGTAERGRMKAIVFQSLRRQLVEGWRGNTTAERGVLSEPRVIQQDQDNIGSPIGRFDRLWKLWRVRIFVRLPNFPLKFKIWSRKHLWRCI